MDIAFVVQRYGAEVAGGAEALCRDTARALVRAGDDVTVYTTTARDYLSWEPFYPPGDWVDDGVVVRRFAVDPPNPSRAADLVRELGLAPGDPMREAEWAKAQGPVSRDMLRALRRNGDSPLSRKERGNAHDVVVCWTYLYATSQLVMPLVRDRAVLVPLAHEEPMLRFDLTRGVIRMARAMAFFAAAQPGQGARADAAAQLRDAMATYPELVAGEGRACTELMRAMGGRVALKTGAEAFFIAIIPQLKMGVALKVVDGGTRGAECAIAAILVKLGVLEANHPATLKRMNAPIRNWNGVETGMIRPAAALI